MHLRWRTSAAVLGVLLTGCAAGADDRTPADAGSRTDAAAATGAREEVRPPAPPPIRLDLRCERGRVLCADKSTRTLWWVVDGEIRMTFDARFGVERYATREGVFEVYDMLRHHESSLYGTQMPFAMFFSGGQAVHYSRNFATKGYNDVSHGCINLRDRRGIAELFRRVREGDKVVVYRS